MTTPPEKKTNVTETCDFISLLILGNWVDVFKKIMKISYIDNENIPTGVNLYLRMLIFTTRKESYTTMWFMHSRVPEHQRFTLCTAHAHSTKVTLRKSARHSDKGHFHVVTSQSASCVVCWLTSLLFLCAKSPTQSSRRLDLGSDGESVLLTSILTVKLISACELFLSLMLCYYYYHSHK